MSDKIVRICVRVSNRPFLNLEVRYKTWIEQCFRCDRSVWVSASGKPAELEHLDHPVFQMCMECACADPEIGPSMAQNYIIARGYDIPHVRHHVWNVEEENDQ